MGGALFVWYHRQLWEAAEEQYCKKSDFRAALHLRLAKFFSWMFSGKSKPCSDALRIRLGLSEEEALVGVNRHVRDQPLALMGTSVLMELLNILINFKIRY